MESFFKMRERGSNLGCEVVGGLTTFLAMAYIAAVNPSILAEAGVPFQAALTSTCFGAAAGARTGLSNVVVGALFVLIAFFSPLVGMVTGPATCGALVVVGYLMMTSIGDIDWSRFEHAFPAFLVVLGRARSVKPLMWVSGFAFLVMFIAS